jgi:pimeloyl-ACP methyl ester carboxylesterase
MPEVDAPLPVLLVHGAWHGAWCFAALQAELDRRAVPSYAIDLPGHGASSLPLGDLHGDAEHVAAAIDALTAGGGQVVLVGHSYGGAVVTQAAAWRTDRIAQLVYLTAFALADGESLLDLIFSTEPQHVALAAAVVQRDDGTSVLDPDLAGPALYATSPPAAAAAATARLSPQPASSFAQPVSGDPRSTVPSTYVVCLRDEAVHPVHQRLMAARCGAVVELDSDHSPFLTDPTGVADVIEPLARGGAANQGGAA